MSLPNKTIIVSSIGIDAGPFGLFSCTGATCAEIPFELPISRRQLLTGFTTTIIPDGTTVIRVASISPRTYIIPLNDVEE